jgi:adenylate cyclase
MRIPLADLQAAGLYDPAAPGAPERLALLEWLANHGASLADLERAARGGSLLGLVGELVRRLRTCFTLAEFAARAGMAEEHVAAMRFAVGLPTARPDEAVFTENDLQAYTSLVLGEHLFGKEASRRFLQVIGSSLARIAEAAVTMSLVNLEAPARETPAGDVALAQARFDAIQATEPLAQAIGTFFMGHIQAASQRLRRAVPRGSVDTARVAVGFVDLVGFTALSRRMDAHALAAVVERFEETAHDVAAQHDGRVVKFVGDEVMFVAADAATACDVALTLVETFAGDAAVTPRGGLAAGEVVIRGGDYYGPIVNLAARLADLAVPREILVTAEVAAEGEGGRFRFEPAGKRLLKGVDEPVRLFTAERGHVAT